MCVCAVLLFIHAKAMLSPQAGKVSVQDILETALPFDLSEKNARDWFGWVFLFNSSFCALCDRAVMVIMIDFFFFLNVCVFILASFGAMIFQFVGGVLEIGLP